MTTIAPRPKLEAIQGLRALAALMVVVGHVFGNARARSDLFGVLPAVRIPSGAGVDVFFLVSGFIMVLSSQRMFGSTSGARDFLLRRLVRIVPLYWAATALMLAMTALGTHAFPTTAAIAASLAFFPYDTHGSGDGFAFPVLDLGWTLNYEMMFYLVFALFVPLVRPKAVWGVAAMMAGLVAVGLLAGQAAPLAVRFWTQQIILEFVAGMLIAQWYLGSAPPALSGAVRMTIVGMAMVLLFVDPFAVLPASTTPNDLRRVAGWGIPAALLLFAAVTGPTPLQSRAGRLLVLLGDSSYALYLFHPFGIVAMMHATEASLFPHSASAFFVVLMVGTCIGAIVVHLLVERPITTRITRWMQRHALPIGAVPLPPDARVVR